MSTIAEIFSRTGQSEAVSILKEDHHKVQGIFDEFEKASEDEDLEQCRTLAEKALIELTVHARIEEEIFYPAVRAKLDDTDIMDEALEEHHAAKLLITELVEKGLKGERFEAKFCVLSEMVRHHIKEEESDMLPKAHQAELDFEQLGTRMVERKTELMEQLDSLDALKRFGEAMDTVSGGKKKTRAAARPAARRASRRTTRRAARRVKA